MRKSRKFVEDQKVGVKKEWTFLILAALFGAALGVRWIAILQTPVIANDAILYIKSAKLYFSGAYKEGFRVYPYSLLPIFIAFLYRILGDWVLACLLYTSPSPRD